MKLVVVESPTKAKTISKFLGKDYFVTSCMGHIRDLPKSSKDIPAKYKKEKWATLGVNVTNGFSPIYCVPKEKTKVVKELKQILSQADELILATDEDREGESISWHLLEVLSPKIPVKRMVFHEITKEAISNALKNFRDMDSNLVKAQEARRVLDRLVGYTISPLLWKKIAYGLSAGRVQSVAIKLITERELQRIVFQKASYDGILSFFEKDSMSFQGRLIEYKNQKVAVGKDFDTQTGKLTEKSKGHLWLKNRKTEEIRKELSSNEPIVTSVEEKPVFRKPPAPFITSTLQQEANRKLNWSSKQTMSVAQKLYENGLITYMRTDSTFLSRQALESTRKSIEKLCGKAYVSVQVRDHSKKKAKGAQEAHEAIRPAGAAFLPPERTGLRGTSLELYALIFKRTLASQMKDVKQKQVSVKVKLGEGLFSCSGLTTEFDGFLKVYDVQVSKDTLLPKMKAQEKLRMEKLEATHHQTKPPSRYTEASLIQTLEQEGVGRPSTYAPIMSTIQDRGYVKKEANTLFPTFTAMVVTQFLRNHLPNYVDLEFTSKMEESLDEIAKGRLNKVHYLSNIYFGQSGLKETVELQEKTVDSETARQMSVDVFENISIRVGRYGAYVCRKEDGEDVCASLPENLSPGELTEEIVHKLIDQKIEGSDALGKDPETQEPIYALSGRYGPYVQRGDASGEGKVKRVSLPPGWQLEDIDLKKALWLLTLPRLLGEHPETKKDIKMGIGRFGPFVVHDGDFRSIPKDMNLMQVNFNWALETLSQPKKGRGGKRVLKELGSHPDTEEKVQIMTGRYGDYVNCGKVNVSLPDGESPDTFTLSKAVKLLEDKMKAKKTSSRKKASKKTKTTKKKTSGRKTTTRSKKASSQKSKPPQKTIKIRRKKKT